MLHTHLVVVVVLLVASALIISGCGSGSPTKPVARSTTPASLTVQKVASTQTTTETSEAGTPLTRAQLLTKADAICARVDAKTAANPYRNPESIARIAPALAAYEQAANTELAKLIPPASLATDWYSILAGEKQRATNTAELGKYAKAGELTAAFAILLGDETKQKELITTARHDGFTSCARFG